MSSSDLQPFSKDDLEGQCRRYSVDILTCQGITLLFLVTCILTEMNCKVMVYLGYSWYIHGVMVFVVYRVRSLN